MLVSQILNGKPFAGVVTIVPGISIAEAAEILSKRKFGALVVSADGTTADGILSERDIVRELGKRGAACLSDTVADLMTRDLVTCTREDSAIDILEKMTAGRFRHMPVIEGGKLIGMVSIGDVVKARLAELAMEKDALTGMIMGS